MRYKKRIKNIQSAMSGFRDEKHRREIIQYLKRLDPTITAKDIQTHDDFINIMKTFIPPIPNTPEYEAWLGTEQHKKYMERQKHREDIKERI